MNKQLLPCPFCGGANLETASVFTSIPGTDPIQIRCRSCDCGGPTTLHGQDQAKQLWNIRPESKSHTKSKGTYEEVAEFCKSIRLPETDAEYFFNKCEGCGWTNGGKPIKDWRATIRSWKAAGYMPSTKQPVALLRPTSQMPVWKQVQAIENQLETHPANPSFRGYRADKVTPEQKEHYENQKANLKRLKGELL